MSPLWPDFAFARAAWADVAERGLVADEKAPQRRVRATRKRLFREPPAVPISSLLICD
jgi:hypothetical protein